MRDSSHERTLFEVNPAPICRIGRDGAVVAANPAARGLFGGDAILGKIWTDACPQMTHAEWSAILRSPSPVQHEAVFGTTPILFTYVSPSENDPVFAFGSDVTALHKAEQALAEKAAELAELARLPEMNPGPVLRLDLHGIVLGANSSAKSIFGDAVIGRRWPEICPGMDRATWQRICPGGGPVAFQALVKDRAYVLTHRCDLTTKLVFVFGTDVTEQKDAEKALRHSEKMAMLGTLAAGVVHELNNPAAATVRASDQLREALTKLVIAHLHLTALEFSDEGRVQMEELEEAARMHASRPFDLDPVTRVDREILTEEWLDERDVPDPQELAPLLVAQGLDPGRLSELEAVFGERAIPLVAAWGASTFRVFSLLHEINQGAVRISEIAGAMKGYAYVGQAPVRFIDLHEGLDNTLVILGNKLKGGITVLRQYDHDLGPIYAHGGELNQVWTNLIDNAADALNGKGTIIVRTAKKGDRAVVEIEDDGPGIPQEFQSRVFDPFFTTKEPGKGTGLGLSVTYAIVTEQHKGELTCESRPGRTVFTVELPLNGSAQDPRSAVAMRGDDDGDKEG